MHLQSGDIVLRNAVEKDFPQLCAWWNDGAVMAHAGFPNGLGITVEEIAKKISTDSDDTRRRLVMEYRGILIGEMSFRNHNDGSASIGIDICRTEYQNKGFGRIILSLLIRELFARGYAKIVLDTNLNNLRAQHFYELLGFRKLRVNIDSWKDQLGNPQSSVDYELYPEDFHDYSI